jgi:hypothetical protein
MNVPNEKTLIGVLASHDSSGKNLALSQIFTQAYGSIPLRDLLRQFRFVFTGGTYRRLFESGKAESFISRLHLRLLPPKC